MQTRVINNKRWLAIAVLLYVITIPKGFVYAQESYRTFRGTIVLSFEMNNEPVQFISNELDVLLNYETAQFKYTLKKSSIRATYLSHIQLFKPDEIIFSGKLGIEFIKTNSHPVQIFGLEGILSSSSGQELAVHASGSLSHLYSNSELACWLNITMQLDKHDITGFILDGAPDGATLIKISNAVLDKN